eukprot:TRINITY_DN41877_c2_g1_i2.p1 TRINITY_DN41877_c2_g1~~TRINITY_DN41877_c2_g1_i2.p1  ORF type:complete len:703 (-),score=153.14 TRINITY_DN41877_c2_g1_i2:250-2358(-)
MATLLSSGSDGGAAQGNVSASEAPEGGSPHREGDAFAAAVVIALAVRCVRGDFEESLSSTAGAESESPCGAAPDEDLRRLFAYESDEDSLSLARIGDIPAALTLPPRILRGVTATALIASSRAEAERMALENVEAAAALGGKGGLLWKLLLGVTHRAVLDEEVRKTGACPTELAAFEYDARCRAALRLVARWCGVPWTVVQDFEVKLAALESELEKQAAATAGADGVSPQPEAPRGSSSETVARQAQETQSVSSSPSSKNPFRGFVRRMTSGLGGNSGNAEASSAGGYAADGRGASSGTSSQETWSTKRILTVGGAALGGGVLLAVTGGLAAPALAAGITAAGGGVGAVLGGSAVVGAVTGVLAGVTASSAIVGSAFGVAGASLVASKTARLTAGISTFDVDRLQKSDSIGDADAQSRLSIVVCLSGFLTADAEEDDFTHPWHVLSSDFKTPQATEKAEELVKPAGDVFTVRWEPKELADLGSGLKSLAAQQAASIAAGQIIQKTVFAAVSAAVALPATLLTAAYAIDNRWSVGTNRADAAGVALAEWLLARPEGCRPATLVGASLGGRAVLKALLVLASKPGGAGLGIVEKAVILGAPLAPSEAEWQSAASVCAFKLINAYSSHDYTLSVLFRTVNMTTQIARPVAGIAPIKESIMAGLHEKVENVDVSDIISGDHLAYQSQPQLQQCLLRCGLLHDAVTA